MELTANKQRESAWGGGTVLSQNCDDACILYVYFKLICIFIIDEYCDMEFYLDKL